MEDPSINYNSYSAAKENMKKFNSSRNKSFSHYLSHQEAYSGEKGGNVFHT